MEGKVVSSPRINKLVQAKKTDPEVVEELYLATLARLPNDGEKKKMLEHLAARKNDER